MTVGVVILVHNAFDRAEQVIRHWVKGGCPVAALWLSMWIRMLIRSLMTNLSKRYQI